MARPREDPLVLYGYTFCHGEGNALIMRNDKDDLVKKLGKNIVIDRLGGWNV